MGMAQSNYPYYPPGQAYPTVTYVNCTCTKEKHMEITAREVKLIGVLEYITGLLVGAPVDENDTTHMAVTAAQQGLNDYYDAIEQEGTESA